APPSAKGWQTSSLQWIWLALALLLLATAFAVLSRLAHLQAIGHLLILLLLGLAGVSGLVVYQRQVRMHEAVLAKLDAEREAAFARLVESEERFRSMLQHFPVAYFALDPQGLWVDANQQALLMLRAESLATLLDRPFVDSWETGFSAVYSGSFEKFRAHAGPVAEMTLMRGDGRPIVVVAVMQNEYFVDQRLRRVHCLLHDISEQVAMREQLVSAGVELESRIQARTRALTQANDMLRDLARRDELTGLMNRLAGNELLQSEFAELRRSGHRYAVLLVDIDHFKRVNDTHGHAIGDEVLRQVAQVLLGDLRRSDFLARYGGEEFLAVLPGTDGTAAKRVADKLRAAVESTPHPVAGRVTISVGIAIASAEDRDERTSVDRADDMLYEAKQAGRNTVIAAA
ncbi:MAG: diguanylate cyclase, partial [Quisquiliibacterium sp.]